MPPSQPAFPESPYFSDEGRRIRDAVVDAQPLLREHAREGEELGTLAPATLAALHEIGVFRLTLFAMKAALSSPPPGAPAGGPQGPPPGMPPGPPPGMPPGPPPGMTGPGSGAAE